MTVYPGLDKKVAVVTGSGRGIGRCVAVNLSSQGARVVVNYKRHLDEAHETERRVKEAGGDCVVVQADVSTDQGVSLLFDAASKIGGADILVNCAGLGLAAQATEVTSEMWSKQIDTSLRSVFMCSTSFIRQLRSKNWGRIVSLSSIAGIYGMPLLSVYSAAKAGIIGLTKALATEAPPGLTVNAVAPGLVKTKMGESLISFLGEDEESWARSHSTTGRLVTPEEVAELISFLSSDLGASITGQVIVIDGGQGLVQGGDRTRSAVRRRETRTGLSGTCGC